MCESDVYKKCPSCGYEYEMNYGRNRNPNDILKGDEEFIRIDCVGRAFETDKNDYFDRMISVYLYGCPKCKSVHYEER